MRLPYNPAAELNVVVLPIDYRQKRNTVLRMINALQTPYEIPFVQNERKRVGPFNNSLSVK